MGLRTTYGWRSVVLPMGPLRFEGLPSTHETTNTALSLTFHGLVVLKRPDLTE